MCGIAGLWQTDGTAVDSRVIQAMTDTLAHRGPDGQGIHVAGDLAFGHRRLAILDLSDAGHQPMAYAGGRYWITYNGEVYNFLELQQELEQHGHSFRSSSDTEVILAAYAHWGPDCLKRFNGMWGLAIWDAQEQSLFLARDRFGIKPLFYILERDRLAFASEWKALLCLPGFVRRVDWSTFVSALQDPYMQEGVPECLLHGIRRLLPGHYLLARRDDVRICRWWNTLNHLTETPSHLETQAEQFRALFEDACRVRMRSDVPIGTSLSGGLDSSSVVCMLANLACRGRAGEARRAADWQRAFVATFPETPVDEREYADLVVQQTGVTPIYLTPTAQDFTSRIDDVVYHNESLEAGPLLQLWTLYQSQRCSGVVVTLDGHGGDELLGGYASHVEHALYDAGRLTRSPATYLEMLGAYRALFRTSKGSMQPGRSISQLARETSGWLELAGRWKKRSGLSRSPAQALASPRSWLRPEAQQLARATEPPHIWPGQGRLGFALYREFHQTMLPAILSNYDRMSMAHGVEVRMPFLDWRLVTFAFSLPPSSKVGRGYTKLVLREAMRGLLPERVRLRRDKLGFTPPLADWFNGPLRPWLADTLASSDFTGSGVWDGAAIRESLDEKLKDGTARWNDLSRAWPFIQATLWLRLFALPGSTRTNDQHIRRP